MWREFKAFLLKQNVLALAIAVVVGAALSKLVTALVDDFIMPIVAVAAPGGQWQTAIWAVGPFQFRVGDFASAVINFFIIGFVAWRISKALIRPDPVAPATRPCPSCRMSVDLLATRCPYCTSALDAGMSAPATGAVAR
jgi:large conductance mechanosensitive channel